MPDTGILQVLVVCAANQCRSRVAEALLQSQLSQQAAVCIGSAGTRVLAAAPMCPDARAFAAKFGAKPVSETPSIELSAAQLAEAHLVLAVDTQVRTDIVALNPEARARTFTLNQAAAAAEYIMEHELVARARAAHRSGFAHVIASDGDQEVVLATALPEGSTAVASWLALELAAAHAHAALDRGLDIADAHTERGTPHRRTLEAVQAAVGPLALLLLQLQPHT